MLYLNILCFIMYINKNILWIAIKIWNSIKLIRIIIWSKYFIFLLKVNNNNNNNNNNKNNYNKRLDKNK